MTFLKRLKAWAQRGDVVPDKEHELRITMPAAAPSDEAAEALVQALTQAVSEAGTGRFDEYEYVGDASLLCVYFLGANADALLESVTPVLRAVRWAHGAEIYQVYGNPMDATAREVIRTLNFDG